MPGASHREKHESVKVKLSIWKNRNTGLQKFSYHPVHPTLSQAAVSHTPAFKFTPPCFKISQQFFYAHFLSATLSEHSNMGFSCLLRFQPYAECQLAWSKDDSKAPPRLSVQVFDLYLKAQFLGNAFLTVWSCTVSYIKAEHTEGAYSLLTLGLCTLQSDLSTAKFTAGSSHLRPVLTSSPRLLLALLHPVGPQLR